MEKRIFDNIINFLLSYEQNEITFEWTTFETGVEHIDWEYGSNDLGRKKIPSSIMNIIVTIIVAIIVTIIRIIRSNISFIH